MSLTEKLIKPTDLPGGDFFSKGAHVLPLDKITGRFENRFDEFFNAGKDLGGYKAEYGDVSLMLLPFPRVPVFIILWAGGYSGSLFPASPGLRSNGSSLTCQ
ncbi:MAG: DUF3786 domain-containing protein [Deltaproteobacteria bacterium]|nr:DUF3786 domain-containing protein [Deltaproteobacteria bacterium]